MHIVLYVVTWTQQDSFKELRAEAAQLQQVHLQQQQPACSLIYGEAAVLLR